MDHTTGMLLPKIQTVKYADDLVLLDKEGTILQGMIDRLIEIGIRH
jgi:hypothetical protein